MDYPYSCRSINCGYTREHSHCQACSDRPALDAWTEWRDEQAAAAQQDYTGASHPYFSPSLAGWGRQN